MNILLLRPDTAPKMPAELPGPNYNCKTMIANEKSPMMRSRTTMKSKPDLTDICPIRAHPKWREFDLLQCNLGA